MRNLKKIIALLAVVAMMISTVAQAATFTDVAEATPAYEAVETLNALGIIKGYEDGTFGPDKTITRAEFAAVVCRAVGLDTIIAKQATIFSDVVADHWASGYISMAAQMRVVNGMGDGTFAPEDPVTYEQAVKMIMVALGYEPKAKEKGGFPTGYLVSAADAGVTSNIGSVNAGQAAPRGLVARLLYKAIDTPMMEQVVYGGETTYQIQDGTNWTSYKTLMSEKLGVTKIKALVTGNSISNLTNTDQAISNTSTREETAKIQLIDNFKSANEKYAIDNTKVNIVNVRVGNSNVAEQLGKRVIVYLKEETGETDDIVITAVVETGKNIMETFSLDTFERNVDNKIEYMKNESDSKVSTLQLNPNASYIFNYRNSEKAKLFQTSGKLATHIVNGAMTLNDYDNDGYYDVVFIESPEIKVVSSVSTTSKRVSYKNGGSTTLDTDADTSLIYKITKEGKEITLADLNEWDVLSIYTNKNSGSGLYFNIKVISNTIEGTVSEISSSTKSWNHENDASGEGPTYYIDGKEYMLAVSAYNVENLKNNSNGVFYIDEFGKIAAFKKGENVVNNYAFVTGTDEDSSSFGTTPRAIIQILEADGSVKTRKLAKNVTFEYGKESATIKGDAGVSVVIDKVDHGKIENLLIGKLIRFNTNSSGEVSSIELSVKRDTGNTSVFQNVGTADYAVGEYTYDVDAEKMALVTGNGRTFYVDTDTVIFNIKHEFDDKGNKKATFDADSSSISGMASLVDEANYKDVQAFDLDSNTSIAGAIVIYDAITFNTSQGICVYVSTSKKTTPEGDNVTNVKFFQDGELQELATDPDYNYDWTPFKKGDGFQVSVNGNNYINEVLPVYNMTQFAAFDKTPLIAFNSSFKTNDSSEIAIGTSDKIAMVGRDKDKFVVRFGVVKGVNGNNIEYGPAKVGTLANWINESDTARAAEGVNVYVYDQNKSSDYRLFVSDSGDVNPPDLNWDEDDIKVMKTSTTTETLKAPVIEARDHVIIKEYDGDVTDVIIIKPYNYTWSTEN